MRAWRDRNSAPQRITSLMVVFDPTGVLWCFCFTVFSFSVSLSRGRFTPSACHRSEKHIVKFFSLLMNAIAQLQSAVVVGAVDSQGNTLEFLLSPRRDAQAAKSFFAKALAAPHTRTPRVITVDKNACTGYLGHPVRHVTGHSPIEYRQGLERPLRSRGLP
jgi:hypothetical protein